MHSANKYLDDKGTTSVSLDQDLDREIDRIQRAIEIWVKSNNLWGDCSFMNYLDHVDAEPWNDYPVVTIFGSDGDFNRVFDGSDELYESFSSMLNRNGYWFERDTCIVYILSADDTMNEKFKDYFHWQWICSMLKPDFNDIHHELFKYFEKKPEDLQKLSWREFEFLVYELFRHQGFKVQLGPGRGDGGIDMTLIQTDPIGDILTAVQAKRYRSDRAIDLQAVQALYGATVADELQKSAFITTSRYLPSAQHFAGRENVGMDLYVSEDVIEWCKNAHHGIVEDKKRLVSRDSIERILSEARKQPRDYIVHSHIGVTIIMNSFAIKLKETKHAALLLELPKIMTSHDGYETRGLEIPVLNVPSVIQAFQEERPMGPGCVFRAKKYTDGKNGFRFWTGKEGYSRWDGEPKRFDLID